MDSQLKLDCCQSLPHILPANHLEGTTVVESGPLHDVIGNCCFLFGVLLDCGCLECILLSCPRPISKCFLSQQLNIPTSKICNAMQRDVMLWNSIAFPQPFAAVPQRVLGGLLLATQLSVPEKCFEQKHSSKHSTPGWPKH